MSFLLLMQDWFDVPVTLSGDSSVSLTGVVLVIQRDTMALQHILFEGGHVLTARAGNEFELSPPCLKTNLPGRCLSFLFPRSFFLVLGEVGDLGRSMGGGEPVLLCTHGQFGATRAPFFALNARC